jgi:DNA polymerase-3 subunit delta'
MSGVAGTGPAVGVSSAVSPELFAAVVGQEQAVVALRSAALRPVHAYLFRGAAGNGGLLAAHGFAAALLCPDGGCGVCQACRSALAGSNPDLHVIHRSGAQLSVDDAQRLVAVAQRRPLQAARQVVIVTDVHLARLAAPALLKTLEEPPGATVFVLLADDLTPELATIASRCVEIPFPPVPRPAMIEWLVERGATSEVAAVVADTSGGNPARARVMIDDPEVAQRAALWAAVPDQLTGTGVVAAELARELLASAERAVEPLRAEHARELERLTEEAAAFGEKSLPGRKEITDRHQREERRWRTDALRAGLGALARAYRDKMVTQTGGGGHDGHAHDVTADIHAQAAAEAVTLITDVARALIRNPQETLLLQSLLVRLGALST